MSIWVLFDAPPFSVYRVSPIGIAEGKYSGKKRLILDLSSLHNDATRRTAGSETEHDVVIVQTFPFHTK
jgi:hypothetical protein